LEKKGANLDFLLVICPNGKIILPRNRNGKYTQQNLGSFFKQNRKEKE